MNNDENEYKEIYFGKISNYSHDTNKINDFRKEKISGFAEASRILDHLDNHFVDFSSINNGQKHNLPKIKNDFESFKFNNKINNKRFNKHFSFEKNINRFDNNINKSGIINHNIDENPMNDENNNININHMKNNVNIDDNIGKNIIKKNNYMNPLPDKYNYSNKEKDKEVNLNQRKENDFNDIKDISNSNSNFSTNFMTKKRKIINNIHSLDIECKILYKGECNTIPELKIPIPLKLSSLIMKSSPLFDNKNNKIQINNENNISIDIEILIQQIKNRILSINDRENKIVLPSDEDFYFQINGKIYSKLTNTNIYINNIEKRI